MAADRNAFKIRVGGGPEFVFENLLVTSGAAGTIAAGSPVKAADAATAATGAVVPMVDGDGAQGQNFVGIAKTDSTDTAAAAGAVDVWMPLPGIIYQGVTKTSTDANTAALVQALFRKRVVFDLSSTTWSVDSGASDALINAVTIIGGDYRTYNIFFTYRYNATVLGQRATS